MRYDIITLGIARLFMLEFHGNIGVAQKFVGCRKHKTVFGHRKIEINFKSTLCRWFGKHLRESLIVVAKKSCVILYFFRHYRRKKARTFGTINAESAKFSLICEKTKPVAVRKLLMSRDNQATPHLANLSHRLTNAFRRGRTG